MCEVFYMHSNSTVRVRGYFVCLYVGVLCVRERFLANHLMKFVHNVYTVFISQCHRILVNLRIEEQNVHLFEIMKEEKKIIIK